MLALKVLGAGQHVGRSATVVSIDGLSILLDCGIQIATKNLEDRFPDLGSLFEKIPGSQDQISQQFFKTNPCNLPSNTDKAVLFNSDERVPPWKRKCNERLNDKPKSISENSADYEQVPLFPSSRYRSKIDAVLITHFHLDHIGALPYFTEILGYDGPVFMTENTLKQARLVLEDCWLSEQYTRHQAPLLQAENMFRNEKKNASAAADIDDSDTTSSVSSCPVSLPPSSYCNRSISYENIPLTKNSITKCLSRVSCIPLQCDFQLKTINIRAFPAGHVLGACMFVLVGSQTGHSVVYTGDFTTSGEQLIQTACIPQRHPTVLITESTYGSQVRDSKVTTEQEICCVIENAIRSGGKVLIPVSAIGKAQEIAILLAMHWDRYGLSAPIILGSGMINNGFNILQNEPHWSPDIRSSFRHICTMDVRTVLNIPSDRPVVYFGTPRSMTAGSSLYVLKSWGLNPKNLLVLLGFSVPGTVAYQIIKGSRSLQLPTTNREESLPSIHLNPSNDTGSSHSKNKSNRSSLFLFKAKMRYFSLATHADSLAIQHFVRMSSPTMTVLVHGESQGMEELGTQLRSLLRRPVCTPHNNEVIIVKFPSPINTPNALKTFVLETLLQENIFMVNENKSCESLTPPFPPGHPIMLPSPNQLDIRGHDKTLHDDSKDHIFLKKSVLTTMTQSINNNKIDLTNKTLQDLLIHQSVITEKWLDFRFKRMGLSRDQQSQSFNIDDKEKMSTLITNQMMQWCPDLIPFMGHSIPVVIPTDTVEDMITKKIDDDIDIIKISKKELYNSRNKKKKQCETPLKRRKLLIPEQADDHILHTSVGIHTNLSSPSMTLKNDYQLESLTNGLTFPSTYLEDKQLPAVSNIYTTTDQLYKIFSSIDENKNHNVIRSYTDDLEEGEEIG